MAIAFGVLVGSYNSTGQQQHMHESQNILLLVFYKFFVRRKLKHLGAASMRDRHMAAIWFKDENPTKKADHITRANI